MICDVCVEVRPAVGRTFHVKKKIFIPHPQAGMLLYNLSEHDDFASDGMRVDQVGYDAKEKAFYVFLQPDDWKILDEGEENKEWDAKYTQKNLMEGLYLGWEIDGE
jgi:hypothetical protein